MLVKVGLSYYMEGEHSQGADPILRWLLGGSGTGLASRVGRGCWDRLPSGLRRLRPAERGRFSGMAGRTGSERLMCLPCRMFPLGMGYLAWLFYFVCGYWSLEREPAKRLWMLLRVRTRDVDFIACWPSLSATSLLKIHCVLAAPSEGWPLDGSLH